MENTKKEADIYGIVNAAIQISAILSYQYLNLIWPLYAVMVMIGLLGLMQTLSAGYLFSKPSAVEITNNNDYSYVPGSGLQFLVGVSYAVSSYHIYLIGFETFAGFAFAHTALYTMMIIFKGIKQ